MTKTISITFELELDSSEEALYNAVGDRFGQELINDCISDVIYQIINQKLGEGEFGIAEIIREAAETAEDMEC